LAKRIKTGKTPSHLWIDSKSTTVWVSIQDSDELMSIDLTTQSVKSVTPVGKMPADVFGTPDDKLLLVGLTASDGVAVYDISGAQPRLVKKLPTGKGAHAFRALGDRKHVLVSNRVANTVSQIDYTSLQVVAEFPGPSGPDCMEVTADGKLILLASRWARKLTVIDIATRKVIRQVPVGKSPHGVWTLDHAPRQ
jgi:YVTN family beta-propeller protein